MASKQWLELRVPVPSEVEAHEVAEALIRAGGTAVRDEGDALVTYVADPGEPERFVRGAAERLRPILSGGPPRIEWRWVQDEDWTARWREGLEPRRVGRRLLVTPSWTVPDARPDDIVIAIEPGMAFGTGEHGSTRGVLRLLERCLRRGDRVLDVGTGTGILAVAAVELGAASVLAVERDAEALGNARDNLARNGAAHAVELRHGAVDPPFLEGEGDGAFDLITANVLSGVLVPLLPAFRRSLAVGGRLILGGILVTEAGEVGGAADRAGFTAVDHDVEGEWWSGAFER